MEGTKLHYSAGSKPLLKVSDYSRYQAQHLRWGKKFYGANGINNFYGCTDLKDMSVMVLRTKGPGKLPEGYKLTMHISQGDAESVRVFRNRSTEVSNSGLCE